MIAKRVFRVWCVPALVLIVGLPVIAAAPPPSPEASVIEYLDHTIEWYRRVTDTAHGATHADEILFRDTVQQDAEQTLHLAFAYARAQAGWLATQAAPTTGPAKAGANDTANIAQAAANANQRVTQIQGQIQAIDQQLNGATQPSADVLSAKRKLLEAELDLAKARQSVLQDLVGFNSGASGGLIQKIDDLEKSIPESQSGAGSPAPGSKAADNSQEIFRPESAGILNLITEMFTLNGRMKELGTAATRTAELKKAVDELRTPIRTDLRSALRQSDALAKAPDTDDQKLLASEADQFTLLSGRFKILAATEVPLRKQSAFLDSAQTNLTEWRAALQRTYHRTIRALLIRIGAIAGSIAVLLGISWLWRRATFRYVSDVRRRRQFLLIRRLVVGAIIVVIVIGGIVTEFSTLVTCAGLITAGIAVALQTVILSGVAHFFFMGRYGVRVGDRVTISGTTGDVIDIGIFRLYLMELTGSGGDLNPTGRIVVFSNSVLFQPSAFFKQVPGADYGWHEITLSLAPDTDPQKAEKKLLGAIEGIFAEYKGSIDKQYSAIRESVHFHIPEPHPIGRLRISSSNLEFVIRYPVDIRRSAEIDDKVIHSLLETIRTDSTLHVNGWTAAKAS